MKTIWKYKLYPHTKHLMIPSGAQIISTGLDREDDVCIWAIVDSDNEPEMRRFHVIGTGFDMTDLDNLKLIGSVSLMDGELIFHVFEQETPD